MHSQTPMRRLRTPIHSRRPTRHLRRTLNRNQTHHAQRPTTTNQRRTETIHTRHSVRLQIPQMPMPRLQTSTRRHQTQTTPKRAAAHPRPTASRMRRTHRGAMNTQQTPPQNRTHVYAPRRTHGACGAPQRKRAVARPPLKGGRTRAEQPRPTKNDICIDSLPYTRQI
jgi:hypothetical protein